MTHDDPIARLSAEIAQLRTAAREWERQSKQWEAQAAAHRATIAQQQAEIARLTADRERYARGLVNAALDIEKERDEARATVDRCSQRITELEIQIEGLNLAADQYSESRDAWMLRAKAADSAHERAARGLVNAAFEVERLETALERNARDLLIAARHEAQLSAALKTAERTIDERESQLAEARAALAVLDAIVSSETPIAALDLATTWQAEKHALMDEVAALKQAAGIFCPATTDHRCAHRDCVGAICRMVSLG